MYKYVTISKKLSAKGRMQNSLYNIIQFLLLKSGVCKYIFLYTDHIGWQPLVRCKISLVDCNQHSLMLTFFILKLLYVLFKY